MQQRLANTSYIMIIPYVRRKLFLLISYFEWNIDFIGHYGLIHTYQYHYFLFIFYYKTNKSNISITNFSYHLQLTCYKYCINTFFVFNLVSNSNYNQFVVRIFLPGNRSKTTIHLQLYLDISGITHVNISNQIRFAKCLGMKTKR